MRFPAKSLLAILALAVAARCAHGGEDAAPPGTPTNGVIASLRAPFAAIESLSLEIRRTTEWPGQRPVKTLSTVYFKRPDKFHSETVVPFHRRVLADGHDLRIHVDGAPKGGIAPISSLKGEMLANMRAAPGTPEAALMALEGSREFLLVPTNGHARVLCITENSRSVLEIDGQGRLAMLSIFDSSDAPTLETRFHDFAEIAPGVWMPLRHVTTSPAFGKTMKDVMRVVNPVANGPLAPSLFDASAFFKDVAFERME